MSISGQISKMWPIHTTEYYSAIKRNRARRRYLEEGPQKYPDTKGHMYDSIYMKCPERATPQRQEADYWLPGAGGGAVWFDGNILKLDRGDGCISPQYIF